MSTASATSSESLIPGYRQVDAFSTSDDYESEEETSFVTLDLGAVEPALIPSSSTYRLIGLDTSMPYLQLSGTIFKGRHDSLLGSELYFSQDEKDPRSIAHIGTTSNRVVFREVILNPKRADSPDAQADNHTDVEDTGVVDNNRAAEEVAGKAPVVARKRGRPKRAVSMPKDAKRKGKQKASEEGTHDGDDGEDDGEEMLVDEQDGQGIHEMRMVVDEERSIF